MPTHQLRSQSLSGYGPLTSGSFNSISKFAFKFIINSSTEISIPLAVRSVKAVSVPVNTMLIDKIYLTEHPGIMKRFHRSEDEKHQLSLRSQIGTLCNFYSFNDDDAWHETMMLIIKQLSVTSRYFHQELDIAHRDLKPLNLLVGSDGLIKWIDFDSACHTKEFTKEFNNTPDYTPPEVYGAHFPEKYSHVAHDAFAIGMIIVMLLKSKGILKSNLAYADLSDEFCRKLSEDPGFKQSEDYKKYLAAFAKYNSQEQVNELFSSKNRTKNINELAQIKAIVDALLESDWKKRIANLRMLQKEVAGHALDEYRLFKPKLHFTENLKSWAKILEDRSHELTQLKKEKRLFVEKLDRLLSTSGTYRNCKFELGKIRHKIAMLKAERMDFIFTSLLQFDKENVGVASQGNTFKCDVLECRKRNFIHTLVYLVLNKSIMEELYVHNPGKKIVALTQENSRFLTFRYQPVDSALQIKEEFIIDKSDINYPKVDIEETSDDSADSNVSMRSESTSSNRASSSEGSTMSFDR